MTVFQYGILYSFIMMMPFIIIYLLTLRNKWRIRNRPIKSAELVPEYDVNFEEEIELDESDVILTRSVNPITKGFVAGIVLVKQPISFNEVVALFAKEDEAKITLALRECLEDDFVVLKNNKLYFERIEDEI